MQIDTAENLLGALRDSGLFAAEELRALAGEFAPLGDDPPALMRHILQKERLSLYQLRKIVHGKAHELYLGVYVIHDKLGEGGMGKVYRARDTRTDKHVALKVIRPSLIANPVIRGRYEREVQAATALRHPNVVGLLDAGEADGKHYMAMEFVDGIDLARLVRTHGILPIAEACEYLRQASLGLQAAHDLGFVHRDIKPSNIVVSGERHLPGTGEPASVKILDMGLVRTIGFEEPAGGTDLTRDGTVVGTPDYMSPEQAKDSRTVDRRSDLYSLGSAFYFLLTGKPPFHQGTAIEKLLKHQVDPPPPLQAARPDVPAALAVIVARLMAKAPEERYQTAAELAARLAPLTAYTEGIEVTVTPPPRPAVPPPPTPSSPSAFYAPPSTMPEMGPGSRSGGTPRPERAPPTPPPVAPSDRTPRPARELVEAVAEAEAEGESERSPVVRRPRRRKPRTPQRSQAPLILAVLVLLTVAVAVVAVVLAKSNSSGAAPAAPAKSGKTK